MWLLWTSVLCLFGCFVCSNGRILPGTENLCPSLQNEGPNTGETNANRTGFNLIRRFSLQKMSSVKKIKNPKGPIIMRLGGARLVESTSQVFPHGFPDQFTLVVTLLLKKQTTDEDWYLFQISDHLGYPQISIGVNGKDRTVSLQARGQDKEYVGSTFAGQGLYSLFDNGWHKIVLSVQEKMASIHIDCSFISFKPIEPRAPLAMDGHTFIGLNTVNGSPVHIDIQKFLLYCDPLMAMQEGCCEILPAGVSKILHTCAEVIMHVY
ncbi:Hypothetical predicted protein [Pelobates cultripes]|uniref:Collagen alpha-1(XVI) chain n=1 Tax=Pelobates cultripes TaxID=61616 RepID=A0AAD1VPA5_PELCU|nr:Hypothetical predicted protein [Pelobates cultripes]